MAEDLRTQKTKMEIRNQFVNLLLKKNFNNITVKDITREANIGRGTFYLHFKDKYDLLQTIIEEAVTAITDKFHPAQLFEQGQVIPARGQAFISEVFGYFQAHEKLYRALLFNEGLPSFRYKLQQQMLGKFQREVRPLLLENHNRDPLALEIVPQFVSSGMIGLVGWSFENHFSVPKEAIARNIIRILSQIPYL
ncbi:TetR/AcrR family transcriptional regulator [Sporolactobacillus spathodeae]|uniref:AcrR family transcriptional regulator n=1 Tax=Sporolactobacillus spathodeae TaxID=1465502 RepID=A0ABS2Q6W2_9BACL|nr:TetR/AcrR family transcriptional regulator [Sporolactobacillus spathodeae]MBM7656919.1 AcrR family transcriptional regulator [Sporolactobacillus spathodeae]